MHGESSNFRGIPIWVLKLKKLPTVQDPPCQHQHLTWPCHIGSWTCSGQWRTATSAHIAEAGGGARCGALRAQREEKKGQDTCGGYDPRYPQDKTWAAPSEVAHPTRSRRARHWSTCTARYCIVPNMILSL